MKVYLTLLIVLGLQMSPLAAADKNEAPKPLPPKIVQTWRNAGANVGWMNMNLHLNWHIFRAEGVAVTSPREWWWDRTSGMPVFQFSEWEEGVLAKLPDPGAPFGLCLNLTKMTDAGLKELAGLKSLQALYLAETQGNGRGVEGTGRPEELANTRPSRDEGDGRGAEGTGRAAELAKSVPYRLPGDGYRAEGSGWPEELARIEPWRHEGDGGGTEGCGLKSLQVLYLYNTAVTDVGLKELAGLKSLHWLNLAHSPGVTDAGLKDLAEMKSLKYVRLYLTKVTAAGAAALKKGFAGVQCSVACGFCVKRCRAGRVFEARREPPYASGGPRRTSTRPTGAAGLEEPRPALQERRASAEPRPAYRSYRL